MENAFILSAKRTPTGAYGGALSTLSAVDLGVAAVKSVLLPNINSADIESIVMGNVVSANLGQNPARQVGIKSGLSTQVCATNVNKVCASGMKAISILANEIMLGQVQVGICGGMESMSNVPHYIPNARFGIGYGDKVMVDGLEKDGLLDAYSKVSMGVCGDMTAQTYDISREEQDAFAQTSFERAQKANFSHEIIPMQVISKKTEITFSTDEPIAKANFEKMRTLRPAFSKEGTVTAANASGMSDGASALLLASQSYINKNDLNPLAKIIAYAEAEHEPNYFTTAPISATHKVLKKAGLSIDQIDLVEVNEAFAVVAIAYQKELKISAEKINIKGGAVALGHALGSSGSRIVITLLHALIENNKRFGLAAICNGGGGASAIIIENVAYE